MFTNVFVNTIINPIRLIQNHLSYTLTNSRMSSNISSDIPDISYSSDSDISSNAEELQMLEKLKINENDVINNEKEMQKKIIQYEQKIRELQEELNSQGSTSDINRNVVDHQIENKISNSFASQSSKSENLELITTNSFKESDSDKGFCQQKNIFRNNYSNNCVEKMVTYSKF